MAREYTIWSNTLDTIEAIVTDIREEEEYQDLSERELTDLAYEINNSYLDDEKSNLSVDLHRPMVCISNLGLWYGKCNSVNIMDSGYLPDTLTPGRDDEYSTWYVNEQGDLTYRGKHHDGTNYSIYRVAKEGVDRYDLEDALENHYGDSKKITEEILGMTEPLGPIIGKIYGWGEYTKEEEKNEKKSVEKAHKGR